MLKIGITGSMGSGKSMVARIFSSLGIPVYNADEKAKELYNVNPEIKKKIKKLFGAGLYDVNDCIIPEKLAGVVFGNTEKLALLNSWIHPLVITGFDLWTSAHEGHSLYVVKEAALLFESGAYKQVDKIICVTCPLGVRIERILKRNPALSTHDIKKRNDQQWSEKSKIEKSDFSVCNNGTIAVLPQVLNLHKIFLQ